MCSFVNIVYLNMVCIVGRVRGAELAAFSALRLLPILLLQNVQLLSNLIENICFTFPMHRQFAFPAVALAPSPARHGRAFIFCSRRQSPGINMLYSGSVHDMPSVGLMTTSTLSLMIISFRLQRVFDYLCNRRGPLREVAPHSKRTTTDAPQEPGESPPRDSFFSVLASRGKIELLPFRARQP